MPVILNVFFVLFSFIGLLFALYGWYDAFRDREAVRQARITRSSLYRPGYEALVWKAFVNSAYRSITQFTIFILMLIIVLTHPPRPLWFSFIIQILTLIIVVTIAFSGAHEWYNRQRFVSHIRREQQQKERT